MKPDNLMMYANNKLNIRKSCGKFNSPDVIKEKIISSQAQLESMKKKFGNNKVGRNDGINKNHSAGKKDLYGVKYI